MALPGRTTHEPDWADLLAHARRVAKRTGRDDWEDIAQDAILRLWTHLGEVDQPRGWLTTVTARVAVDHVRAGRSRRRGGGRVMSLDATVQASDDSDSKRRNDLHDLRGAEGGDPAEAVALRLMLWPVLRRLTTPYRLVLVLRAQDWRYQDIAEALRIPAGTVKSRTSYAARRMRKLLSEEAI